MPISKKLLFIILSAVLIISLSSCSKKKVKESILSNSINTNLINADLMLGFPSVSGPIEFLVTSPREIKSIQLDSAITHEILLEKVEYESKNFEGYFTQGIVWSKNELSDNERKLLSSNQALEKISNDLANSNEFKDYYFYNGALIIDSSEVYKSWQAITHLLVETDQVYSIEIGKIQIFDRLKDVKNEDELSGPLIRNFGPSFGRSVLATRNRKFEFNSNQSSQSLFQTNESIVIDSIEILNNELSVDKFIIRVKNDQGSKSYNYTQDNLKKLNLEIEAGSTLDVQVDFISKQENESFLYAQTYDLLIRYHNVQGNNYLRYFDSGVITSTNDFFFVAANDTIKQSIENFYFEYLPANGK